MVPEVKDPKSRKPAGRPAGADFRGENRPAAGDDRFKDLPQSDGLRRYEVRGGPCNSADKTKASSNDTKSTKSGSGSGSRSGSGDGSGSHDDDTPPGSHRSSPSMEAKSDKEDPSCPNPK